MTNAQSQLLDAELAAFMQQDGISLTVGSCGADLRPSVGRAVACKLDSDRGTVHLFVSRVQVAPVLAHVRQTGRIAAVFTRPSTHRTLQLKGRDARVGAVAPGDLALVERARNAIVAELSALGYAEPQIRTLFSFPDEDLSMISFTPQEAYSQTPGPNAGRALQVGE